MHVNCINFTRFVFIGDGDQ